MSATVPSLGALRARRTALEGELQDAESILAAAREGLVDGSLSAAKVVSAQSLVHTLQGALETLGEKITHVAELEAAERALAQRRAAVKHLATTATDAEREQARLVALTAKACAALDPLFEQMAAAVDAWAASRETWRAGAVSLAPGLHQPHYEHNTWAVPGAAQVVDELLAELGARADLSAVLTRVHALTPQTRRDNPRPLDLPDHELAAAVFALFRRYYHARSGQNRLEL